jgi:ATP/maltotriose-dependent transcriptional regulator MalT
MNLVQKIETLSAEEAKKAIMQELSLRALQSVSEDTNKKYFIRDTNGNVVGNKKGYNTHKGAKREAEHGKTKSVIWDEYYKHHEQNPGSSNNLVHSIKLEEVDEAELTDLNEEQYGYHEDNPKIDLHNKYSGEYIASTNYAKSVKQAVQKYEEKYPDMKGHVRGYINKK